MKPLFSTINALCPIYAASERERPELIGSAVLLDFGKARFLVTAAHVHDWSENNGVALYTFGVVDGRHELVRLPPMFLKTICPASGQRDDDKLDFAFIRLDPSFADQIAKVHYFLPFGMIDVSDKLAPSAFYMFTGYPISREKTHFGKKAVRPKRYSLTEGAAGSTKMRTCGFDPETHIAINFAPASVKDEGGNIIQFPKAKGMSGGPVWRGEGGPREWLLTTNVKLVGIGIEDRVKEKMMVAVRIHLVTYAIGEEYHDVKPFVARRPGFDYSKLVASL